MDGNAARWLEWERDRLCLSAPRPLRPRPWPTTEEVETVRALGVVDPVTVRSLLKTRPTRYEIVSGEKLWLAAQPAGLAKIAVLGQRLHRLEEEVRRVQSGPTAGIPSKPIQEARARCNNRCSLAVDADPHDPDHAQFEGRLSELLRVPVTVEYAREGARRRVLAFGHLDGLLERLGDGDDGG
jgi:hypothetical protein